MDTDSSPSRAVPLRNSNFPFLNVRIKPVRKLTPEELIAAAAAACFGMALSKTLQDDDQTSDKLRMKADVTLSIVKEGPKLADLKRSTEAVLPEYTEDQLRAAVMETAENCPVFQLLRPGLDSMDIESSLPT